MPRGKSLLEPKRSQCPNCGHEITALENIPLVSYVFLRGRCRNCGTKISARYPFTELLTALLFAAAVAKFDATVEAIAYALFFWILVVLTVIDLELKKLPDKIVLPTLIGGFALLGLGAALNDYLGEFDLVTVVSAAVALGIAVFMFWPGSDESDEGQEDAPVSRDEKDVTPPTVRRTSLNPLGVLLLAGWGALLVAAFNAGESLSLAGSIVGAALFSGFFFSAGVIVQGGMGGGDIKLALALGAFAGYLGSPGTVLVAMFMSVVAGGIISMILLMAGGNRKSALPFGPFLALGTVIAVFWGQSIQDWYGGSF